MGGSLPVPEPGGRVWYRHDSRPDDDKREADTWRRADGGIAWPGRAVALDEARAAMLGFFSYIASSRSDRQGRTVIKALTLSSDLRQRLALPDADLLGVNGCGMAGRVMKGSGRRGGRRGGDAEALGCRCCPGRLTSWGTVRDVRGGRDGRVHGTFCNGVVVSGQATKEVELGSKPGGSDGGGARRPGAYRRGVQHGADLRANVTGTLGRGE